MGDVEHHRIFTLSLLCGLQTATPPNVIICTYPYHIPLYSILSSWDLGVGTLGPGDAEMLNRLYMHYYSAMKDPWIW